MTFLFIIALIALAVSLWLNNEAYKRIVDLEKWNAHLGRRIEEAFNRSNHAVQETKKMEAYYDKQIDRVLAEFSSTKGIVSALQSRIDKVDTMHRNSIDMIGSKISDLEMQRIGLDQLARDANGALLVSTVEKTSKPQPQTRSRTRSRKV